MGNFETTNSRKNTKISFRTDDETIRNLKAIGRIENQTISALIEGVLKEHMLRHENPISLQVEKRQSLRRPCFIPAVISEGQDGRNWKGVVINLSLNSMQLILKKSPVENLENKVLLVLFDLPLHSEPLLLHCYYQRVQLIHDECVLILSFNTSDDIGSALNRFLLEDKLSKIRKNSKLRLSLKK